MCLFAKCAAAAPLRARGGRERLFLQEMQTMPKVLVLFEFPTVNGGENSWLTTVDTLRNDGWGIVIGAPAHGPLAARFQQQQLPQSPAHTR